jgi:hypothetical protein
VNWSYLRDVAEAAAVGTALWVQWRLLRACILWAANRAAWLRIAARCGAALFTLWILSAAFLAIFPGQPSQALSASVRGWIRGSAFLWGFNSTGAYLIGAVWKRIMHPSGAPHDPARRKWLEAAGATAMAAPVAFTAFGALIERTNLRIDEIDFPMPGLPQDLSGLRILQISDVHLGVFLSERELARVIDAANELKPHLVLATGDFISEPGDPLEVCLRQIGRIRSDAGTFGCNGNHEKYSATEPLAVELGAKYGIRLLRDERRLLRFGNARMNLAGVDHQSVRERQQYLRGASDLIAPEAFNVLMSHNPDVFPVAAKQGFDLTVAGHTHGGQISVEILKQGINPARFVTPFIYGKYRLGRAALYVTRGVGTIGLPIRWGAPPEIALLRLTQGRQVS